MDVNKNVAIFASPLPGGNGALGSVIETQYKEDYYIELYTNNNSLIRYGKQN